MRHNRIEVYVVWFVIAVSNPHTFEPELERDVYKECWTLREAEEKLAEWYANDIPTPDDYVYAYIEHTDRLDD
jgi:hypothetical protein